MTLINPHWPPILIPNSSLSFSLASTSAGARFQSQSKVTNYLLWSNNSNSNKLEYAGIKTLSNKPSPAQSSPSQSNNQQLHYTTLSNLSVCLSSSELDSAKLN